MAGDAHHNSIFNSFLVGFGNVPGCPKVIGLTCVFGSAPNAMLSPQNNLLFCGQLCVYLKPDHRFIFVGKNAHKIAAK